jgi:hypothetical protein
MSTNIVSLTVCFVPLLFQLVLSNPVLIPGADDKEEAGQSQHTASTDFPAFAAHQVRLHHQICDY